MEQERIDNYALLIREAGLRQELADLRAKLEAAERDAGRWRYTQQKGYFCVGPTYDNSGIPCWVVGIQWSNKAPINKCIKGEGETLAAAIDAALKS